MVDGWGARAPYARSRCAKQVKMERARIGPDEWDECGMRAIPVRNPQGLSMPNAAVPLMPAVPRPSSIAALHMSNGTVAAHVEHCSVVHVERCGCRICRTVKLPHASNSAVVAYAERCGCYPFRMLQLCMYRTLRRCTCRKFGVLRISLVISPADSNNCVH